ncbi:MAG TPA: arylesterase [Vicinamibacterales bacterium]|jgi:acyl-CoA thioesterase-1|nr:arylesterase [Vicinamibacterales bacterium]
MTSWIRASHLSAWAALIVAIFAGAVGCSRPDERTEPASAPRTESRVPSSSSKASSKPRIVILGDSLTAGLGLPIEEAYPALIQQRLNDRGLEYEVINGGVSGDTSAGGLSRVGWALQGDVRVLVVALGGNDALRGLPTEQLKTNLAAIIEEAQGSGIAVILAGMEAPPNYGREYQIAFHKVYPALARDYKVAFIPFLLQNVAGSTELNQQDGIHPTPEGARIVADNVWSVLEPLVERLSHTKVQSQK